MANLSRALVLFAFLQKIISNHVVRGVSTEASKFRTDYDGKGSKISSFRRQQQQQQQQQRQQQQEEEEKPNEHIYDFELWDASVIEETLLRWAEHYPNLIQVTTSQESHGLPTSGGSADCPFSKDVEGCLHYWYILQDFESHPEGSDSSNRLPEVLWSGELHGDEQVGPTATLEATQLLLEAATCESLPRTALKPKSLGGVMDDAEPWNDDIQKAKECREDLYSIGVDDEHRKWLARLITTRRIVVVPTANALGYYQKIRTESRIDPNRDFPYDLTDPKDCMQSIAARTLNEIYREHMFQLSLTFHGGMEVIGYEWGAPTWSGYASPDDVAQANIAKTYSRMAGKFADTPDYAFGNMNDLVYPVRGGFEDWAYAGSFDPDRVIQCEPLTYGGYPKEKTIYSNSTLRAFNMLVEAADYKIPPKEQLGSREDIMNPESKGNGHIARNIRLALMAAELVEPYVFATKVNELDITDDIVPLAERGGWTCQKNKMIGVPIKNKVFTIEWKVGGALEVDETRLFVGKWSDIPEAKLNCLAQPSLTDIGELMTSVAIDGPTSGTGFFSEAGATTFRATVDIESNNFQVGDELLVIASAKVDQSWKEPALNMKPELPPQSHVVNARTNPEWHHEMDDGKVIQGRLDWFSIPFTLIVGEESETIDLSDRFRIANDKSDEKNEVPLPSTNDKMNDSNSNSTLQEGMSWSRFLILIIICCFCMYAAGKAYLRYRMRISHRERVREFIDDPTAITPGLRAKEAKRANQRNGYSDEFGDGVEMPRFSIT